MDTPSVSASGNIQRTSHSSRRTTTSLNEHLNTEYINVAPDDTSASASLTRTITACVGKLVTPRKLLIGLRILKAITFCFLTLTICADLMYIIFLEMTGRKEIKQLAGGRRDTILRIYGLALAVVAMCIELDYGAVVEAFYGFKGFIPRSLLLFFVSVITGAHPLHAKEANYGNAGGGGADDDDYFDETELIESQIPHSAINFQMVTSYTLGACAITYFIFGCMCLDRFTARAFMSTKDPLISTAIPMAPASGSVATSKISMESNKSTEDPPDGTYTSPPEF